MFPSRFLPCEECGAAVDRYASEPHLCDVQRRVDYQMFLFRDGVERFEDAFAEYVGSPVGRFEAFLAMRRVRRQR
ncbi:MAG TPA: hypothetical protein VFJ09_00135 [Nocardioidaceae bacterium]|nr:hypothetical protein [Nocardioidaceae bacterium]